MQFKHTIIQLHDTILQLGKILGQRAGIQIVQIKRKGNAGKLNARQRKIADLRGKIKCCLAVGKNNIGDRLAAAFTGDGPALRLDFPRLRTIDRQRNLQRIVFKEDRIHTAVHIFPDGDPELQQTIGRTQFPGRHRFAIQAGADLDLPGQRSSAQFTLIVEIARFHFCRDTAVLLL